MTTSTTPIRLLFVDDHPVIAAGLAARYAALPDFAVAGTASSFQQAIDHIARANAADTAVDIAVVDVQLEVTLSPRQVAALAERTRVVVFSGRSGDPIVQQLIAAGAAGALDKSAPLTALDALLRDVHAGVTTTTNLATATTAGLSEREREVFAALARCLTPKEVADTLGIARSTVYCHIDRIRQKLGVETLQEIVALALSPPRS